VVTAGAALDVRGPKQRAAVGTLPLEPNANRLSLVRHWCHRRHRQMPSEPGLIGARRFAGFERLLKSNRLKVGPRQRQDPLLHLSAIFATKGPSERLIYARQHQGDDGEGDQHFDQRKTGFALPHGDPHWISMVLVSQAMLMVTDCSAWLSLMVPPDDVPSAKNRRRASRASRTNSRAVEMASAIAGGSCCGGPVPSTA